MDIIKVRAIGNHDILKKRLVEVTVAVPIGSEIDLGLLKRDECVNLAQFLRDIADELEDN